MLLHPRIRGLMIVVGVLAALICAGREVHRLYRLSCHYRSRANDASVRELAILKAIPRFDRYRAAWLRSIHVEEIIPYDHRFPEVVALRRSRLQELKKTFDEANERAEFLRASAELFGQLKRKYNRSASRPWEEIAPDPSMPPLPSGVNPWRKSSPAAHSPSAKPLASAIRTGAVGVRP